jgi:hypothetical protein
MDTICEPKKSSDGRRLELLRGLRQRSRVTNGNVLLPNLDHRSTWARRYRDLIALHLSDLGGEENATEAEKALVRRVAALITEIEIIETKLATVGDGGSPKMLDLYGRMVGHLRRVFELLGTTRRAKDITPSVEKFIATYGEDESDVEDAEVVE